jgi:hypothetical protein
MTCGVTHRREYRILDIACAATPATIRYSGPRLGCSALDSFRHSGDSPMRVEDVLKPACSNTLFHALNCQRANMTVMQDLDREPFLVTLVMTYGQR